MRMRMWWLMWAAGCTEDKAARLDPSEEVVDSAEDTSTDSGDSGEVAAVPIDATARLLDPLSGGGVADLTVASSFDGTSCTSGSDGRCTVTVAAGQPFALDVTGASILPHLLQGDAADQAFESISFVATASLTDQIYGLLGVSRAPDKGTVVVGLDTPALSPAYGASASIGASSELTFVFGASRPIEGDTLVDGGSSIVTFVNVEPGAVVVSPTGADGTTCLASPAEQSSEYSVQVTAGVISIVTFICR